MLTLAVARALTVNATASVKRHVKPRVNQHVDHRVNRSVTNPKVMADAILARGEDRRVSRRATADSRRDWAY